MIVLLERVASAISRRALRAHHGAGSCLCGPSELHMRHSMIVASALCLALLVSASAQGSEASAKLILVHYMPWFESKQLSGKWGWHWTMDHFDPDERDDQGERQIASHYHPLIGPYDSADPDLLEYHTLLMKIAGVDGVIADWYGNEDVNDYGMIHRRTGLLFDACRKRGLNICVCYEERILKAMVEAGLCEVDQMAQRAKTHLQFCQEQWFKDPHYL